jgi:hypothetical protein
VCRLLYGKYYEEVAMMFRGYVRLICLLAVLPAGAQAEWLVEIVDDFGVVGFDPSIALDTAGNPHISYTRDGYGLKYAMWDGSAWQTEYVSQTTYGWMGWPSVVVDGDDTRHLTFSYASLPCIYYCVSDEWGVWALEQVATGTFSSLALDQYGQPGFAYYSDGGDNLWFARKTGTGWELFPVDDQGDVGQFCSFRIGSDGSLHIAYTGDGAKYAFSENGVDWEVSYVDSSPGPTYRGTSLALDSQDRPRITYNTGTEVRYACWTGTEWQIETIDAMDTSAWEYGTSLALDQWDRPCVAYCSGAGGWVMYASDDGTGWASDSVGELGSLSGDPDLVLDSAGQPHIAFYSGNPDRDLMHAWNDEPMGGIEPGTGSLRGTLSVSPNPFGSSLEIVCGLTGSANAELAVYDLSGRRIETLCSGTAAAGDMAVRWTPGAGCPPGCYLVVLDSGGERMIRRAVLLR